MKRPFVLPKRVFKETPTLSQKHSESALNGPFVPDVMHEIRVKSRAVTSRPIFRTDEEADKHNEYLTMMGRV